jgi:hypothetical protein
LAVIIKPHHWVKSLECDLTNNILCSGAIPENNKIVISPLVPQKGNKSLKLWLNKEKKLPQFQELDKRIPFLQFV